MIGILGGTFDPVHCGHLRTALEVQQALGLTEVHLIPAHRPPHRAAPLASPQERVAMLQAGVTGAPGLVVDTREIEREGPSYTVDTLVALRGEPGSAPLCLIMGTDAFRNLCTWHRWTQLFELSHIVVVQRPGTATGVSEELARHLDGRRAEDPIMLSQRPAGLVLHLAVTRMDISASQIRGLIASGRSPRYLLPDRVLELIEERGIYAPHRPPDTAQAPGGPAAAS